MLEDKVLDTGGNGSLGVRGITICNHPGRNKRSTETLVELKAQLRVLPSRHEALYLVPSTVVAHSYNPRTWELWEEGSEVQSHPSLHTNSTRLEKTVPPFSHQPLETRISLGVSMLGEERTEAQCLGEEELSARKRFHKVLSLCHLVAETGA